jgi:predicted transcriptional regulator
MVVVVLVRLTDLELQIMEAFWTQGASSIREIHDAFAEPKPAYTTIQTVVYRLERKKAIRRVKKISNAHIFEALLSRHEAQRGLVDHLLSLFGGRSQPVMSHLVEMGQLTLEDVNEARRALLALAKRKQSPATKRNHTQR